MQLTNMALIAVSTLLLWSEAQDWRLNSDDTVQLEDHLTQHASAWQCGVLRNRMAFMEERLGASPLLQERQTIDEMNHHLQGQWRRKGCDQTLESLE